MLVSANNYMDDSDSDMVIEAQSDSEDRDMSLKRDDLQQGDYVVVRYRQKSGPKYYIGKFLQDLTESNTFEITLLIRQSVKTSTHWFMFPDKKDIDDVDFVDSVCKLPTPTYLGGTKRAAKQFKLDYDLNLNI